MRAKCYLLLTCISLILFFYSIWQIKPVIVDIDDFLGLTSHLTPFYWGGFALILGCSVMAYLDSKLKNDAIFIIILLALGLFLFGPRIFAEANPPLAAPYWYGAGYKDVISHQPIDPSSIHSLTNYSAWPGYHFITAFLLQITGAGYENIMKYMPLLWLVSYVFITFSTGKRLGLTANCCFLISILAITPFWPKQNYYSPQMFGIILYLLLFMLVITYEKHVKTILVTIMTYFVLVITHGLTTMGVILGTIALSIYQRKTQLFIVFIVSFLGWIIYMASLVFETGIISFLNQLANVDLFAFLGDPGYAAATTLSSEIGKITRLFYPLIYTFFILLSVIMYLTNRISGENRNIITLCFIWVAGVVVLLSMSTGWNWEVGTRVYILLLMPVATITTLTLYQKTGRLLAALLLALFIIIHIPANYHTEAHEQTLNNELRSAEFFSIYGDPMETLFVMTGNNLYYIEYYNPNRLYDMRWVRPPSGNVPAEKKKAEILSLLNISYYVFYGQRMHNYLTYTYSHDPIKEWLEANETRLAKVYDCGAYMLYTQPSHD